MRSGSGTLSTRGTNLVLYPTGTVIADEYREVTEKIDYWRADLRYMARDRNYFYYII